MDGSLTRVFIFFFLSCSLLAGASAQLNADSKNTDKQVLKLVTGPHYPPFAADYLPGYGLAPFVITRILETEGRTVTVDLLPWNRAYRNSRLGEYDAVLPYIESDERQEDYLFSRPVFELEAFVYVNSGSGIHEQSLSALKGLTYCNPVGFTDGRALERLRSQGDISRITAANLNNCFRMLMAGRVDFVKINQQVAHYTLLQLELPEDSIRRLPFVVEQTSLHLMVPKTRTGAEALIEEFNARLEDMKQSGQLEKLKKSYLEDLGASQ